MINIARRGITSQKSVLDSDPSVFDDWLQRVRSEYLELPGLRLTVAQAARLWTLDRATCACLLDALVYARFLVLTADGLYAQVGSST
jgi:hypothetical protein